MNGEPLKATASCEGLASLTMPNATITLARAVDAGSFTPAPPHGAGATSEAIVAAYYDAGTKYSYWNGCSAGGRQGMKEAQRFPADFDGIIAGAPGLDWTGRAAQAVRAARVLQKDAAARLSSAKAQLVH